MRKRGKTIKKKKRSMQSGWRRRIEEKMSQKATRGDGSGGERRYAKEGSGEMKICGYSHEHISIHINYSFYRYETTLMFLRVRVCACVWIMERE